MYGVLESCLFALVCIQIELQRNFKLYCLYFFFSKFELPNRGCGLSMGAAYTRNFAVNVICKKITKSTGLIYKASFYLNHNSLLSLYYALVFPYLTYCNLIWASTYVTNLQRIYLLQNRTVGLISKADYRAPSKPLFIKTKILDIFSIYSLQVSSFMYLYYNNLLPLAFCKMFETGSQIHH